MRVDTAGRTWITTKELQDVQFGGHIPEMEQWRRYFGKTVNTAIIEQVLCSAALGFMRDLADLGAEVLRMDPHLAGIVGKRMRAVGSVTPQVTPVSGGGIDDEKANRYADMVRRQLESLPRLRARQVNMAWSAWHGRAAMEIEWAETNNPKERWRASNLHWIHPRRLSYGPERELRINDSLWQGRGFEPIGFDLREIPFKFITSKRQLFNEYPEREGLLIPSLFYSYFKRLDWRERLALMELYGKPMRWIEAMDSAVTDPTALAAAKDTADDMGGDSAAALPPGYSLKVQAVSQGASALHKEIIDDCNSELSKLVLGSTNTTDAQAGGLGSGQAIVHQDGETLVFTADCDETAEDWTEGLAHAIVLLNGGPDDAEFYTPTVSLPYESPPDPEAELGRGRLILDMGLPLKKSEVYERGGFSAPDENEDEANILKPPPPSMGPLDSMFSVTPADTSNQAKEIEPEKVRFTDWRPGRMMLSEASTRVTFQGVPVFIDRPKGFIQTGVSESGEAWSRTYVNDYGFIPNTQGGDGEGIDVFLGGDQDSKTVYWAKQKHSDGSFDEYKLFIGFSSSVQALDTYGAHIPTEYFAGMETTTIDQLKALLGLQPAPIMAGSSLQLERAAKVLGLLSMMGEQE